MAGVETSHKGCLPANGTGGGEKTAKVAIDGHIFDTSKARWHASLDHWDGNNMQYGDVYESSTGIFYVYTPSQWSNCHRWEIQTPREILQNYGNEGDDEILTEDAIEYLSARGKIPVE